MAKTRRKLARDALQYLDPQWAVIRPTNVAESFIEDRDCTSPIRFAAQAKSDISALSDPVQELIAAGFDSDISESAVLELLLRPAIALAKEASPGEEFLHAVVISRDPERTGSPIEDADLRLVIRATSDGSRSPTIAIAAFEYELVDTQDESEVASLVSEAAAWLSEFPAPPPGTVPGGQLVLLGNPANTNIQGVPENWNAKLVQVAAALGMSFRAVVAHGDASNFAKESLVTSIDADVARAAVRNGLLEGEINRLTSMGRRFEDLLSEIISLLISTKIEPTDAPPDPFRKLADGERVFHRKIGKSLKFDRFDQGSTTPCKHGAGGFVRFHGPKSTKGMARRYTNFAPSMLFHCEKYPNCGVYAVFHKS